jgi:hypothetical protein
MIRPNPGRQLAAVPSVALKGLKLNALNACLVVKRFFYPRVPVIKVLMNSEALTSN